MGFEVPPDRKVRAGYGCTEDAVNGLETALKGRDYITGDQFTAADVYVGSAVNFYMQFGLLEKRPLFEAYAERVKSRPAAIRAREIDEKLIAERAAQAQPEPA
jgi:glutathione S-transferase